MGSVRRAFFDGAWTGPLELWQKAKYCYYTESDQLLRLRDRDALMQHVDAKPHRVVMPHRVVPLPVSTDFEEPDPARLKLLDSVELRNNSVRTAAF